MRLHKARSSAKFVASFWVLKHCSFSAILDQGVFVVFVGQGLGRNASKSHFAYDDLEALAMVTSTAVPGKLHKCPH